MAKLIHVTPVHWNVNGKSSSELEVKERLYRVPLVTMANELLRAPKHATECIVCGKTKESFLETHLLGCPVCYVIFENEIKSLQALL